MGCIVFAGLAVEECYDEKQERFLRSAHPVLSFAVHPETWVYICMQDVPDAEKPEYWQFLFFITWLGDGREQLSNSGEA